MKKTLFLKAPLIILNILSFAASIYSAYTNLGGVGWGTPIIIGFLLLLYSICAYTERKNNLEDEEYGSDE
jgi:hypothetical protein